jgi:hypothetical protein
LRIVSLESFLYLASSNVDTAVPQTSYIVGAENQNSLVYTGTLLYLALFASRCSRGARKEPFPDTLRITGRLFRSGGLRRLAVPTL